MEVTMTVVAYALIMVLWWILVPYVMLKVMLWKKATPRAITQALDNNLPLILATGLAWPACIFLAVAALVLACIAVPVSALYGRYIKRIEKMAQASSHKNENKQ